MEKNQETQSWEKFRARILSPLYDLSVIASDVVNGEARDCDFDYFKLSMNYPKFKIDRTFVDDSTKIYLVGDKLQFATRSCALPGAF